MRPIADIAALATLLAPAASFQTTAFRRPLVRKGTEPYFGLSSIHQQISILRMAIDDDDDDDDDIDLESLGDWRQFRATLATSGVQTLGEDSSDDSSATEESSDPAEKSTRKSVSKENEALLKSQSDILYKEYESGIWAHEAPDAEIGGLLCRLPLEAEIYRNSEYSVTGKKLQSILDEGKESDQSLEDESSSDETSMGSSPGVSFTLTGAKTLWWYRKAQALIEEETNEITSSAVGGELDASKLTSESKDFLNLYLGHQDTWQEVCLVTEKDSRGNAVSLVMNRPMSFSLSDGVARLVLFGAYRNDLSIVEKEVMVKFMIAFDKEIYVYLGGPEDMDQKACVVHGIPDLAGSKEIASNTGIFVGHTESAEAAVQGIMQGMYKPSDFRFFVGRHKYTEGRLDLDVVLGKYQPIACSRALALKQCKALPKPLFHEVMELAGGELAEVSKLELMKRDDIQIED